MTHQTHAHHLVSPRPQPLSGAVHVQERSFGRGQGFFPRGRAALLLPATNPLSKVLTLFPVPPPPFPGDLTFSSPLGTGQLSSQKFALPGRGLPLGFWPTSRCLLLPPCLGVSPPSVRLPKSPGLSRNPPSSTSEKRWGLFRLCCGFIRGPPCGPCQHRLLWASASLGVGRKVAQVGSTRLDGVPKESIRGSFYKLSFSATLGLEKSVLGRKNTFYSRAPDLSCPGSL